MMSFIRRMMGKSSTDDYGRCTRCGEAPMSGECLVAVRDCLQDMGIDMSGTPPMFYPEAIRSLVFASLRDAGALPGHKAKYEYVSNGDGSFRKVEITNKTT